MRKLTCIKCGDVEIEDSEDQRPPGPLALSPVAGEDVALSTDTNLP